MDAVRPDRVVLVHDWLTGMRGGEKVLDALCTLCPDAHIFTLLHAPGSVSGRIAQFCRLGTTLSVIAPMDTRLAAAACAGIV